MKPLSKQKGKGGQEGPACLTILSPQFWAVSLASVSLFFLPYLLPSAQCLWDNEVLPGAGANYCLCRTERCSDERDWSRAPGSMPWCRAWGHAREPCGP
jgi:hypothetical protein